MRMRDRAGTLLRAVMLGAAPLWCVLTLALLNHASIPHEDLIWLRPAWGLASCWWGSSWLAATVSASALRTVVGGVGGLLGAGLGWMVLPLGLNVDQVPVWLCVWSAVGCGIGFGLPRLASNGKDRWAAGLLLMVLVSSQAVLMPVVVPQWVGGERGVRPFQELWYRGPEPLYRKCLGWRLDSEQGPAMTAWRWRDLLWIEEDDGVLLLVHGQSGEERLRLQPWRGIAPRGGLDPDWHLSIQPGGSCVVWCGRTAEVWYVLMERDITVSWQKKWPDCWISAGSTANRLLVVCLEPGPQVVAVRLEDGEVAWQWSLPTAELCAGSEPGRWTEIVGGCGWVLVKRGNQLVCADYAGRKLWERDFERPVYVAAHTDAHVLLQQSSSTGNGRRVFLLEMGQGREIWSQPVSYRVIRAGVDKEGVVLFGYAGHGADSKWAVEAYRLATGLQWELEWRGSHGGCWIGAERVYVNCGDRVIALSRDSGGVVWEWRPTKDQPVMGHPLQVADSVLIITNDDVLTVLDADTGRWLWRRIMEQPFNLMPVTQLSVLVREGDGLRLWEWKR